MASLCLSSSRIVSLLNQKPFLSLKLRPLTSDPTVLSRGTAIVRYSSLRLSADRQLISTTSAKVEKLRKRGLSMYIDACKGYWYPQVLCCSTVCSNRTIGHYLLGKVLFFVVLDILYAPTAILSPSNSASNFRGEYGIWTAFVALLTRLFFSLPGELELPFIALLLVIVAPYQVMSIRGKQEGAIISLVISCFLAFQHFSRAGSLQKAFDQSSIVATLGIIAVTLVSFLLLI